MLASEPHSFPSVQLSSNCVTQIVLDLEDLGGASAVNTILDHSILDDLSPRCLNS